MTTLPSARTECVETWEPIAAAAATASTLPPCQYRHNCPGEDDLQERTEVDSLLAKARTVGGSHRKTAYALKENVGSIVREAGVQNCVFFTPTLANKDGSPPDPTRAQACWRKMEKIIGEEFPGGGVRILERGGRTLRLHYHVLLDVKCDVRTGYDFQGSRAAQERSKRAKWALHPSANENLVKVEGTLRAVARRAGFGQIFHCEPVRSETEAIKAYLSKYICKHVGQRLVADKGRRLVGYFGDAVGHRDLPSATAFAFGGSLVERVNGQRRPNWRNGFAWLWRQKAGKYFKRLGIDSMDTAKEKFGPKWAHLHMEGVRREQLSFYPYLWLAMLDAMLHECEIAEGEDMFAPVRFVEVGRRARADEYAKQMGLAQRAAAAMGISQAEAYLRLFQRDTFRVKGHDWMYKPKPVPGKVWTFRNTADGEVEPWVLEKPIQGPGAK